MNREETIALWNECQEAKRSALEAGDAYDIAQKKAAETWNAWAEPLHLSLVQNGGGSEAKEAAARVDFSGTNIVARSDGWKPGTLAAEGGFDASGFMFPGNANFRNATFSVEAKFEGATFFRESSFDGATFSNYASFRKASIIGGIWFNNAIFSDITWFVGARFSGDVSFCAATCKSTFLLYEANFAVVPDFTLANFPAPPVLDHVEIERSPLWNSKANSDHPAAYRALKRMAIAAHDRDREMDFFAGEMRATRFVSDHPWPWTNGWASSGRFWVGMAYDLFSDFGRSMVRPLLCWLATVLLAAGFYLGQANDSGRCANLDLRTSPSVEALQLALRNGLIVLYSGDESAHRIHGCLYGMVGKTETPYVPASVSTVTAVQKFFSLLFIFLIGLALRNMLKMK